MLDLTRVLAGPWCTQNLADLGAEVIKIERPGAGDDTRAWGPPYLKDAAGNDTTEAAYYLSANRNKLSVALDIATPRGAELVRELAQQCDILVENFKVGGLRKYGLDYESVKAINPRLIYCSITGFGQTGPYASRPGYDFMIQGMGGLMSITGERDDLPGGGPQKAGVAVTDLMTGMYSTVGILAALHERNRSGLGQHIDMALLDCQVAMLANQNLNYMTSGKAPRRQRTPEPGALPGVRGQRRPPDRGGGQRQPVPQLLPRDRPARTGRRSALCHQSAAGAEPRRAGAAAGRAHGHRRARCLAGRAGKRRRAGRAHQYAGPGLRRPAGGGPPDQARAAAPERRHRADRQQSAAVLRQPGRVPPRAAAAGRAHPPGAQRAPRAVETEIQALAAGQG